MALTLCIFLSVDRGHILVSFKSIPKWARIPCVTGPHWVPLSAPSQSPVLPHLSSAWLSFSLFTRNALEPGKLPINIYPCLHLIWKLQECLLLIQMIDGPWGIMGMRPTVGRKEPSSCRCGHASPLVVRFFYFGPFISLHRRDMVQGAAANASGSSSSHPARR